ncbi:MAG: hypothetical protein ACI4FZ_09215 [Lachnospiraceae bacterium]
MLGVLYIGLCVLCGYVICSFFFPKLSELTKITGEGHRVILLPEYFVKLPAWYLIGTLAVSWFVYLTAYLFQNVEEPLLYGNLIAFVLFLPLLAFYVFRRLKKSGMKEAKASVRRFFCGGVNFYLLYAVAAFVFVTSLMFVTFRVSDGFLKVGYSVFSDFAAHLGMIRSFSVSNNFPTQYAHYAGEDVRYHFMFQFMVGNLEYLGMRIDYAFNLPSIFSMVSVYLLLFVLAVRLTKSKLCGALTALLFTFRSSFTVFRYMAEQPKGTVWEALKNNTEFLGYTQNENWGLWNLNVYCNQRHLAFALGILLLAILLFEPYVSEMGKTLTKETNRLKQFKLLFFTKTAFGIKDAKFAIGMGLVLGGIAFWNGSVLIATLAMLFFMAAVSEYRLDYLISALIALVLSLLQTSFFIHGSAVSPSYYFGFLAENKTFFGVLVFIVELTGMVLAVALAGACLVRGTKRYFLLVFSIPFVLAFTLSLTIDITVNHKWIMTSLMLIGIFAAYLITWLWHRKDWLVKCIAILLVVVLTATGLYDYTIVLKRNKNYLRFNLEDPLTEWIADHATCDDMFLTPYYSLSRVVLGGAMMYCGWPYYAWSAGYDTNTRGNRVKQMYEAASPEELSALIEQENIRYIIVDHDCRTSTEYTVREDIIESTYEVVFECDAGDWMVRIFDTTKKR